jgi:hypothetical protein
MTYRTFNEWSSLGYQIIRGSKASWIDNKAFFTEHQVRKTTAPYKHHWNSTYSNVNLGDHKGMESLHYDHRYGDFEDKSEGYGGEWDLF